MWIALTVLATGLLAVVVYDLVQNKHAILRNFPIVGHFRYLLEMVGPELRQYIVTSNDEERPFNRDQRRWVYASSKKQNNYFGFGTDNDLELAPNYLIIKHATSAFPPRTAPTVIRATTPSTPPRAPRSSAAGGQRKHAFRPPSIVNVSAMSFGSLSATAVEGPRTEGMRAGRRAAQHRRGRRSRPHHRPGRGPRLADRHRLLRRP